MRGWRNVVTMVAMAALLGATAWAQAPPGSIRVTAGPVAQNISDSSATIWWETNVPSGTLVRFGTALDHLTDTAERPWGDLLHSVQISSLRPDTTYYFELERPSGEVLARGQFHTLPIGSQSVRQLRITDGPRIENVGLYQAVIGWSANFPSTAIVRYGTIPNALTNTAADNGPKTAHRVVISGLQANTTYYFVVESAEPQNGNAVVRSQPAMFHTLGEDLSIHQP